MDRVDAGTGETITFAVPDDILYGPDICVGFLDADRLFYLKDRESWKQEEENESEFEIYRLSDGEWKIRRPKEKWIGEIWYLT